MNEIRPREVSLLFKKTHFQLKVIISPMALRLRHMAALGFLVSKRERRNEDQYVDEEKKEKEDHVG